MKKYIKNLPGGIKFMFLMILVYVLVFFINPSLATTSLNSATKSFVNLLPMLAFVFFVIFIINVFLKPESISRHLGKDSGIKGWVYALIGSVLISGPPYVLYPMLKELRKSGMKYSLIAMFLNNRNVQPAFLVVMVYYFGLQFTVVVSLYTLIFAFINATIIGRATEARIV